MSEPIHDADALARYRQAEAQTVETDIEKFLEPGEGVRECTVPVKPGYGQWHTRPAVRTSTSTGCEAGTTASTDTHAPPWAGWSFILAELVA